MDDLKTNDSEKTKKVRRRASKLGRRDLMKMGVGASVAVAGMLNVPAAVAQQGEVPRPPTGGLEPTSSAFVQHFPDIAESQEVISTVQPFYITKTTAGWVNNSGRANGNGPMDECSRRIVEWVHSFSASDS